MEKIFNGLNMLGGSMDDYQRKYYDKGNKAGYFQGRFLVKNTDSQSRIQAVAQDLNIAGYRKIGRKDLVVEIKNKLNKNRRKKK